MRSTTDSRLEQEYSDFFRAHLSAVRGYVCTLVVESEVDVVVSATFVTAWQKFRAVPLLSGRAWLFGVARHHVYNQIRSDRRRAVMVDALTDLRPETTVGMFGADADPTEVGEVLAALADLTNDEREIIQLTVWHELQPTEIAEVLRIAPNTARVRLHRARKHLVAVLAAARGEDAS